MPDTGNAERLPRIATHKFFDFYIKKHDLISFTVQYRFLFHFICIEFVSLI